MDQIHQNPPVRLGQGHAGTQLAAQDTVLLAQVVIFEGQVTAEKLPDFGNERIGRILELLIHPANLTQGRGNREFKRLIQRTECLRMIFYTTQASPHARLSETLNGRICVVYLPCFQVKFSGWFRLSKRLETERNERTVARSGSGRRNV